MRIGNKKYRLKKSVKRALYACLGVTFGLMGAISTNAVAADTNVTVDADRISIDDYEFFKEKGVVKVTLPDSIQQIGFSSFEGCEDLANINLTEGLCVIDNRAFARCSSLKKINIPSSTVFIGNAAFYGCENLDGVVIPSGIRELSNNMFYDCASLSDVKIPEGVTTIGQQCFYNCVSLCSIDLPNSVTTISDGAFYDCSSLGVLTIPESVVSIGMDAFSGCDNLVINAKPGSYAAEYAKLNNIACNDGQERAPLVPLVSTQIKPAKAPDVPATGVDTHYLAAIAILLISGICYMLLAIDGNMFLVYRKRELVTVNDSTNMVG